MRSTNINCARISFSQYGSIGIISTIPIGINHMQCKIFVDVILQMTVGAVCTAVRFAPFLNLNHKYTDVSDNIMENGIELIWFHNMSPRTQHKTTACIHSRWAVGRVALGRRWVRSMSCITTAIDKIIHAPFEVCCRRSIFATTRPLSIADTTVVRCTTIANQMKHTMLIIASHRYGQFLGTAAPHPQPTIVRYTHKFCPWTTGTDFMLYIIKTAAFHVHKTLQSTDNNLSQRNVWAFLNSQIRYTNDIGAE